MCTELNLSVDNLLQRILVCDAQTASELIREALVAFLANRLFVVLVELGLLVQLVVANGA